MTIKDIQELLFNDTGIKTSVKKGTGSMKGYKTITPMFQGGKYPNIPHDYVIKLKDILKKYNYDSKPLFCTVSSVCIYLNDDSKEIYKKENKPKAMNENKTQKCWGSKNSQLRLDKATKRYANLLRNNGNRARYY